MMKITNKLSIPEALVDGIRAIRSDYQRGECDYTVTQLSKPPMIVRLERDHASELEDDVENMVWAAFGSAFHLIAARGASKERDEIAEERKSSIFSGRYNRKTRKWTVSGQVDIYEGTTKTIYDYKTVSPWVMVFNENGQEEWENQLNVLAEIFRRNDLEVERIANVLLFRGWSESESKRNPKYPKSKMMIVDQEIWSRERTNKFVVERCKLLTSALECREEEIGTEKCPFCDKEEQWRRDEGWAVQKIGRQRAKKIFPPGEFDKAEEYAKSLSNLYVVLPRYGRRIRCESACLVSRWCKDWQRYNEMLVEAEKEIEEEGPVNPIDWNKK